jgi:AraC-like DNA-binding protein
MPPRTRTVSDAMPNSGLAVGLFRTSLAGPGRTLTDAFARLEDAPLVERVVRHFDRDLLGARILIGPEEGRGYWDFIRIRDDYYVIVQNYAYKEPRVELMGGDGLVQFNFRLGGDLTLGVSRLQPIRLTGPSLFVWHQPLGVEIPEWTAPGAHEHSVSISVRPERLMKAFFGSNVQAPPALENFLSGAANQPSHLKLPLNAEMFSVATRLINNAKGGPLGLVYVEALALELLCEALTQMDDVTAAVQANFSARELRCLQIARNLLTKQFAPPPTIRQVAREAGMAETTLKRDFKIAFGETVFDFSLRCRMQQALKILRSERLPIDHVGRAVGYQHPTSFATAFRRHFGMSPKDVRRRS